MEGSLDDATLNQLSAMLGAEPSMNVQRLVFKIKSYADRIGSGAPLPAYILAFACAIGDQDSPPAKPTKEATPKPAVKSAPVKVKEDQPKETKVNPAGHYRAMSEKTLVMLCLERGLTPNTPEKDEMVELLEASDANPQPE